MYPYHNRILQRIKNNELISWYEEENYKKIGKCIILLFKTSPFIRPIRPKAYFKYQNYLNEKNKLK